MATKTPLVAPLTEDVDAHATETVGRAIPTELTPQMRDEAAQGLGVAVSDELALAWHQLHAAQALIEATDNVLDEYLEMRKKYTLSLVLYDNVPAKQVAEAAGVTRAAMAKTITKAMVPPKVRLAKGRKPGTPAPTFRISDLTREEVVARARRMKVLKYPNARAELERIALPVAQAVAVRGAASAVRNEAVKVLVTNRALTQDEAARLIGRDPSRVSHIVTGKGAGTPPREGVVA